MKSKKFYSINLAFCLSLIFMLNGTLKAQGAVANQPATASEISNIVRANSDVKKINVIRKRYNNQGQILSDDSIVITRLQNHPVVIRYQQGSITGRNYQDAGRIRIHGNNFSLKVHSDGRTTLDCTVSSWRWLKPQSFNMNFRFYNSRHRRLRTMLDTATTNILTVPNWSTEHPVYATFNIDPAVTSNIQDAEFSVTLL